MLEPKCQLLQGKGKPGNHKALGILEKNLTKWGVEEEDNQFFAKIDHWVECLKHVFSFQMVAPCIPSNLSHGIHVSQRIPRLQICSWGQFLGCFEYSYKQVSTHLSYDKRLYNLNFLFITLSPFTRQFATISSPKLLTWNSPKKHIRKS